MKNAQKILQEFYIFDFLYNKGVLYQTERRKRNQKITSNDGGQYIKRKGKTNNEQKIHEKWENFKKKLRQTAQELCRNSNNRCQKKKRGKV